MDGAKISAELLVLAQEKQTGLGNKPTKRTLIQINQNNASLILFCVFVLFVAFLLESV